MIPMMIPVRITMGCGEGLFLLKPSFDYMLELKEFIFPKLCAGLNGVYEILHPEFPEPFQIDPSPVHIDTPVFKWNFHI